MTPTPMARASARPQRPSRIVRRNSRPARVPEPSADIPLWPGALVAALVALVYLTVASQGTFHFRPSLYPHHVLIADAWLHGQLNVRTEVIDARSEEYFRAYRAAVEQQLLAQGRRLTEAEWQTVKVQQIPPFAHDWTVVDGKYYGYWGPMVAALLLPYVAWQGLNASDMLFSCIVGAGTVFLTYLMIRQAHRVGLARVTTAACVGLALLLGLGTVHFYLTIAGQVWFLSEIVATFFVTLSICCVLRAGDGVRWSIAAGAALGCATLSRNSVLATGPFYCFALYAIVQRQSTQSWRPLVVHAVGFLLPLIVAAAVILAFNSARFGSPFESGAALQVLTGGNRQFRPEYLQYGLFSFHYLPRNLYYYFINPFLRRLPGTGAITFDPWGNSMFLITPALLYVLRSPRRDPFTVGLWLGTGLSLSLLLLFEGTGWYGFGNRYLLDLMPLAILLMAIGMRGRVTRVSATLIALSIAVNAWGTYRFCAEQF